MSNTQNLRKLHQYKEMFHINMVSIPFFYSEKPTNIIFFRGIPQSIINDSDGQIMKKLYYKNNKDIITNLLSFQSVEKAIQFKEKASKLKNSQNQKYVCQYCKDISQFDGILFNLAKNYVTHPQSKQIKQMIDIVSQMVIVDGAQVQESLKRIDTPILSFLNEHILSLENIYYRWRVYSYLQGDGDKKYRIEPFQILRNGTTWYPPLIQNLLTYPSILNTKKVLFLTQSLQKMQRRKFAIQQIMIFAIHNIQSAVHISSIIIISLYEKLKSDFLGIFYLISDILFNSTNHTYRNIFQSILPFIIYKYVLLKQNDEQKQMNDKYSTQLKKLLGIWQRKYIFDQNFMKGITFMLQLINIEKLIQLQRYPIHQKIKNLMQSENFLYELEKNCIQNGIPYFPNKQEQVKLFLNALFWANEQIQDIQPNAGKYDGQIINEKQMIKIQSKSVKVVTCQDLPISMIYQKNWKDINSSKYSYSQDGYN